VARLSKDRASKISEGGSFEPLPEGVYHVRLAEVDSDRKGAAGPYWLWKFDVVEPGYENRKVFNNTTLAEGKDFMLGNTFAAFGVDATTDTDDLCGQIVRVRIRHRVIQQGSRAGEIGENVAAIMPKADDFNPGGSADDADDDVFG